MNRAIHSYICHKSNDSLFLTCAAIDRLTMQTCIYCFDKAANENSTRSQYKLNMRIYYEDFLSAMTSAALFKYQGVGNSDDNDKECRKNKLKKIIHVCSNSMAMKVSSSEII